MKTWSDSIVTLSRQDREELLADANSAKRQQEFARMNTRAATITPVEWIEFLNQAFQLSKLEKTKKVLIRGNNFQL